jgi:phosphoribosylformylglycinamidine synthase
VADQAQKHLGITTGRVRTSKILSIVGDFDEPQIHTFAEQGIRDPVIHDLHIDRLCVDPSFRSYIQVAKLPGVTDDEGISAQKLFCDVLNLDLDTSTQWIFAQDFYYIEHEVERNALKRLAEDLLGNALVHHFAFGELHKASSYVPEVRITDPPSTEFVNLFVSDDDLRLLSKQMLLSLDLDEMKAIQTHFKDPETRTKRADVGLPFEPTDCEIEILAQTWSEHCKHKEFNAAIDYCDLETGKRERVDSLFNTYIKRATEIIASRLEEAGSNWLLKVFSDNAGVVRIDEDRVFIWKVETHNSPSALDPYGGALTGIVGVNRDPLGTGVGGGRLLFNTNVLCFAPPDYGGALLNGQLHPRRILVGVVKGIEDGGNKSGIPTVNGAVVFDDRYRGKPLVYCGTGAVMPASYRGRDSWTKRIDAGCRIIMAGGRVGKDGIHGATFSSAEIDEHSPRSAVQIGSPITQKNLSDFMELACKRGLIQSSTDNGAGGLSSSVGEMARLCGGAAVDVERVPLKYEGLKPWEIFVSESQERMTFAVKEQHVAELLQLARGYDVELSDIGEFTAEGVLDVRFNGERVAFLDLDFLHEGVPKKHLLAEWKRPRHEEPNVPQISDYEGLVARLLASPDICSKEAVIRRYDHEVKGRTVIKPLMGRYGLTPQDAAVMRLNFDSYEGIAISNGIIPRYGDIDAYEMSAGAFDEAVRQIIAVGGELPDLGSPNNRFWSVNDNFCVPDSVYDRESNPDGKYKLAQLVRMCRALFDMSTFFNIPMTSGKDSMKNDFVGEGTRVSVPPTVLYSVVAKIDDVRNCTTSDYKKSGDRIYLVGRTYDELGGSQFYRLFDATGVQIPVVRKGDAKRVYTLLGEAHRRGLIASCHDISDGGLVVALIESCFGGNFGMEIALSGGGDPLTVQLFSESHSRFVVSVSPGAATEFEEMMATDCTLLGNVREDTRVVFKHGGSSFIDTELEALLAAWRSGLVF